MMSDETTQEPLGERPGEHGAEDAPADRAASADRADRAEGSFLAPFLSRPENAEGERTSGGDPAASAAPHVEETSEREENDDAEARAKLYQELHRRAVAMMRDQPKNHTLQATALVNEVYLKLQDDLDPASEKRAHLLAIASRAMRHVLVDHARGRSRQKRSPSGEQVALDSVVVSYEERALDLLALDEAVERLAKFDETMARAVELRFFGGLPVDETAKALGMPKRTLERRWQATRAWLLAELL